MVDIYIPTKELIVPQRLNVGVSAYISWQVCKVGTNKVVREAGPYKNLITDSGLDGWSSGGSISTMVERCAVGGGSSAPEVGDTSLNNEVAWTSNRTRIGSGVQTDVMPYYGWTRYRYEFSSGAAQGNLSELGFRQGTSNLLSRQLFRDEFGQPTTVTVLSDEFLRITYEIRKYLPDPVDNVQDPVTISGSDYEVTTRPASVSGTSNGWARNMVSPVGASPVMLPSESGLAGITTTLTTFTGDASGGTSFGSYTSGSFSQTIQGVWNPGDQTGQIGRVVFGRIASGIDESSRTCQWQTGFNPPIQKSADDRLTLQFYVEWGRA